MKYDGILEEWMQKSYSEMIEEAARFLIDGQFTEYTIRNYLKKASIQPGPLNTFMNSVNHRIYEKLHPPPKRTIT